MSKYWSEIVKNIEPYIPGEQPRDKRYIKLNTNENPYSPSPKVIEAIRQATNENLRLYPDPTCEELRETIAGYFELRSKEEVFIGNGSDELLAFSFLAFFNPGRPILFPDITYSFYKVYAKLFHVEYKLVPLDEEFNIPAEEFYTENNGVVIPNPNAPTGRFLPVDSFREIVSQNMNSVVIIDEAYIDFGGDSAAVLIKEYPNLLVMQTFSKSRSLAGLRVGFALGHKDLIEGISRIKNSINSYTLDRIALAGAIEAIKDDAYFQETRSKIIDTRERVVVRLIEAGFNVIPSKANFIFISHPKIYAGKLFQALKVRGVLVRYFDKPRIDNFLRVTIGTDEEMECFLDIIKDLLWQQKSFQKVKQ